MSLYGIHRLLPDWGTTRGGLGDGPHPTVLLHGSEGTLSDWMHRTAANLAASSFLPYPRDYSALREFT